MSGMCLINVKKYQCGGFTLIELVTVLVLIGILSAYAATKWPSDSTLKLPAQAQLLASHLQHVQVLAMNWGQSLRLTVTSSGYSVSCVTATATPPCDNSPVIDPTTQQSFAILLETGVSLSGTMTTDFDSLGRPVSAGSLITTSPARTFILSADGVNLAVTLSPLTGFITL